MTCAGTMNWADVAFVVTVFSPVLLMIWLGMRGIPR